MPQAEGQSRGLTYLHLRSPAPGTLDPATAMPRTCVCVRVCPNYILSSFGETK